VIRTSVELRAVMFGTTGRSGDLAPTIKCDRFSNIYAYSSQFCTLLKFLRICTDMSDESKNNISNDEYFTETTHKI